MRPVTARLATSDRLPVQGVAVSIGPDGYGLQSRSLYLRCGDGITVLGYLAEIRNFETGASRVFEVVYSSRPLPEHQLPYEMRSIPWETLTYERPSYYE